jgi:hypothetical protein
LEVRGDKNYKDTKIYEMNKEYSAAVVRVLEEGIENGELRNNIPVKVVRDLIFGGIDYMTQAYVAGHGRLHIDELADQLTAAICDGIVAKPQADDAFNSVLTRLEHIAARLEP